MKKETIIWRFQSKTWRFGFVIPDDREYWGWDFFVNKKDFAWASDEDRVEARLTKKSTWKKPEAKILKIFNWKKEEKKISIIKIVEGIYSWWDWNFWFIDVKWEEKWYFVYWKKKNNAEDWDKVKAEIVMFNWKQEAIIIEILNQEEEIIEWIFKDNDKYWFVLPANKSGDIFIAWSRKWWARDSDMVEVRIIKRWWKNPEWVIKKIL